MSTVRQELTPLVDAVAFDGPAGFRISGQPFPVTPASAEQVVTRLRDTLYGLAYLRRFGTAHTPPPQTAGDIYGPLASAMAAQPPAIADPGWKVVSYDARGWALLTKHGARRNTPLTECQFDSPGRGSTGMSATVQATRSWVDQTTGFYHCRGLAIGSSGDQEPLIRFYWNLTIASAAPLITALVSALDAAKVPFEFKSIGRVVDFGRRDAATLYIHRRHIDRALPAITTAYQQIANGLNDDVPLFSKRLARGLGIAADPGQGESFGQNRCRLLAAGLWQAFDRNVTDIPSKLEVIASTFRSMGLSLDSPWQEAWTSDPLPELVT